MLKVTAITVQQRNSSRVSVSVDGKYRFSLDISQLIELGLKVGDEYSEEKLVELESESQYGKLYARALEYCLSRPHSRWEVWQYLLRKTKPTSLRRKTGEFYERPGVSVALAERVLARLEERGYVNDDKFTTYWLENRNLRKGSSLRKIQLELRQKGVSQEVVDRLVIDSSRSDASELRKVVDRKRAKYPDDQKLIQYLMRQGFRYDDILDSLSNRH